MKEKAIPIAQGLFLLNAAVWLILGAGSLLQMGNSNLPAVAMLIIIVLMVGNAGGWPYPRGD